MKRIRKIKIISNYKRNTSKNKLRITTAKPSPRSFNPPISKSENDLSPEIRLSLERNVNHHRVLFSPLNNSIFNKNRELSKIKKNIPEYEHELKIFNKINHFNKIFLNYSQKHKYSLEENSKLNKENSSFLKQYKVIKKTKKRDIKFLEIKSAYSKKNYLIPRIEGKNKNLFKSNILLNNDSELVRFLSNGSSTTKNNNKCIAFLNRLNELAYKKKIMIQEKIGLRNQSKLLSQPTIPNSESIIKYNNNTINLKKVLKGIKDIQKDILKIKNTIESLDDLENFFSMNNKTYLTLLKYEKSLEKFDNFDNFKFDGISSSRVNSASADFARIKSGKDLSTNFTKEEENTPLNKNTEDQHKKIISNLKLHSPVSSLSSILKSPLNSSNKRVKFKNENSNDKVLVNSENSRNVKLLKNYSGSYKKLKEDKKRIETSIKRQKFYDLLSNGVNTMNYQKEVKEYFLNSKGKRFVNNNCNIKNLMSPKISSKNFERMKFKMFSADLIKKDIQLRSREINDDDRNRKIENRDSVFKNEMKFYQNKIAKIFCLKDL